MAYYVDLFSPETYQAFCKSSRTVSGFRLRHQGFAAQVKPGDVFVCYLTKLSRWFGLLEVVDGPYKEDSPLFVAEEDPFVVRFRVKPIVCLDIEHALPIHDEAIWSGLSFTRELKKGSTRWSGIVRSSFRRMDDEDGRFLVEQLRAQAENPRAFPLSEQEERKLKTLTITRPDKVVPVTVPEDSATEEDDVVEIAPQSRESIKIQASLADIGSRMGMTIWLPMADRGRVLQEWKENTNALVERLPLNYDDTTLRTIQQIDVLWLRGRSIVRAFEVEHTTSVYSGILRMADLLALQPNMDIKLHIVAPSVRREKVFQEIRRPVFSLLERGPLADSCTYLSYDSIEELAAQPLLAHLSDSVLDEFAEESE